MWDLLSMLGKFQDVIAMVIENRDKIKVTNYEVTQVEDVVVVTITSKDKQSANLVKEIISKVLERLYVMQAGGDQGGY